MLLFNHRDATVQFVRRRCSVHTAVFMPDKLREIEIKSYYANERNDTVQVDVSFIDLSQPDEISFADIRKKIG